MHLDLAQHEDDLAGELLRLRLGGAQALGDDAVTDVADLGKALRLNTDKSSRFYNDIEEEIPRKCLGCSTVGFIEFENSIQFYLFAYLIYHL